MMLTIATISILVLTGLVWVASKILPFRLCPICAGVSGTWLWLLGAKAWGYEVDLLVPGILMGGSVVGIAYQLEKRLPPSRSPLLFKTLFIPVGFAAAYNLVSFRWFASLGLVVLLAILALAFLGKPRLPKRESAAVEELEEKMKNCC